MDGIRLWQGFQQFVCESAAKLYELTDFKPLLLLNPMAGRKRSREVDYDDADDAEDQGEPEPQEEDEHVLDQQIVNSVQRRAEEDVEFVPATKRDRVSANAFAEALEEAWDGKCPILFARLRSLPCMLFTECCKKGIGEAAWAGYPTKEKCPLCRAV